MLLHVSTGSALNKCAYKGQQCCNDILIQLVDQGFRTLVEKDAFFNFTSGLADAQSEIRHTINGTYIYVYTWYVYRYLLCCMA